MSTLSKWYYIVGMTIGTLAMVMFYNYGSPCATELSSIGMFIFLIIPMIVRLFIFITLKKYLEAILMFLLILMVMFVLHNLSLELEQCSRCINTEIAMTLVN